MIKQLLRGFAFVGMLTLASCFGQHNNAPNEGVNLDDARIYGNRGGEPKQLNNEYPEDESGEVAQRANAIREKFFPKPDSDQIQKSFDTTATEEDASAEDASSEGNTDTEE